MVGQAGKAGTTPVMESAAWTVPGMPLIWLNGSKATVDLAQLLKAVVTRPIANGTPTTKVSMC